jgi:hypothetical protein
MSPKVTAMVSAIGSALALFAFWPQVQPFADWFLTTSGSLLQRPVVHSVLTAITVGVLLAAFIPHLPIPRMARWAPDTTKAVTRLACVLVTFMVAYRLQAPGSQREIEAALIFSTLAALAASAAWTTFAGFFYRFKARPESLK